MLMCLIPVDREIYDFEIKVGKEGEHALAYSRPIS